VTFTTSDLSYMREVQDYYMQDQGQVGTWSETRGANGESLDDWTYGAAVDCGFHYTGGKEVEREDGVILKVDAELRLPIATTINEKDKFKLTYRYGEDTTDEIYQVIARPRRGPSGLVVLLKAVEE